MIGDVNIPKGDAELQCILHAWSFAQLIEEITGPSSKSTIDHIYSNVISTAEGILDLSLSDHLPIYGILAIQPQGLRVKHARTNHRKLKKVIAKVNWSPVSKENKVDAAYEKFESTLLRKIEECTMYSTNVSTRSLDEGVITPQIRNEIKRRDKLKQKYQRAGKRAPLSMATAEWKKRLKLQTWLVEERIILSKKEHNESKIV